MDYIQSDLELIMGAAGDKAKNNKKIRKRVEKKKTEIVHKKKMSRDADDSSHGGASNAKGKVKKQRAKTLSPKKLKKDIENLRMKEKVKGRKSVGGIKLGTLGKIKLPAMKKQNTNTNAASEVTSSIKNTADSKQNSPVANILKEKVVEKIASPAISTKSRKSLDPNAIPIAAIHFEEGAKIEAVDHGQWYKAKIVQVDNEKMDILVHFDGWRAKFDTWFPMTSNLIRGRTQLDSKVVMEKYETGEDVLAKWSDGNFYPATVLLVKDSGSCQVMYFDGMKKLLRPNMIKKMSEKEKATAMKAIEKMLLLPPSVIDSPLSSNAGSPVSDGTSRRYKTSANDRERRIAARGKSTPTHTSDSGVSTPTQPKRAMKRRASQLLAAKPESPAPKTSTPVPSTKTPAASDSRLSSGDETFHAKKARLDKIADNLVNKVSPTSKSDSSKDGQKDALSDVPLLKEDSDSDSPLIIDEEIEDQRIIAKKQSKMDKRLEASGARGPGSAKRRGRSRTPVPRPRIVTKITKVKEGQESRLQISESSMAEKRANSVSPEDNVMIVVDNDVKFDEKRQQASEALLQLSQATTSTSYTSGSSTSMATLPYHSIEKTKEVERNAISQKPLHSGHADPVSSEKLGTDNSAEQLEESQILESSPPPVASPVFKTGDIVLAKWADCRSYLAYIMKKEPDDNYKIRYYDGMVKVVKSSFIHPWVGPLPDTLKSFKPKVPQIRKHKQKSNNGRFMKVKDKSKLEKQAKIDEKRRLSAPENKTENAQSTRTRRRTESGEEPTDTINFSNGEKVLAKWTDFKWYPATVIKKTDKLHYEVKYLDDLTRIVRDTWLTPWKPPPAPTTTPKSTPTTQQATASGQKPIENTAEPTLVPKTPEKEINQVEQLPAETRTEIEPTENRISEIETSEIKKDEQDVTVQEKRNITRGTTEKKIDDKKEEKSKDAKAKPEEGSITESGDVVGLGEQEIKTYETFKPGDTVLARWTDCRSYPATIKKVLDNGGKYIVEYYDGMQKELKPTMLKSWNPSALPPPTKQVYHRPRNKIRPAAKKDTALKPALLIKDKVTRLTTTARQSQQGPRQVVRGYDAYYARLPAPDHEILETDHHKFKCRVPGCTKSFRKEEMLRTHHKYYHQQRYKLRVQDSQSATVKRKTSKEDVPKRRVSADYESTKARESLSAKLTTLPAKPVILDEPKESTKKHSLRSRGAKPPIDVYKQQHGNVSISSASSMLDSSSGQDEAKTRSGVIANEAKAAKDGKSVPVIETEAEPVKSIKRRGSRKSSGRSTTSTDAPVAEFTTGKKDSTPVAEEQPVVVPEPTRESAEEPVPEPGKEGKVAESVKEDVIRCICDVEEEEGFMIQCEGCFTWQHASCVGVSQPDNRNRRPSKSKQRKGSKAKDDQNQKFRQGEKNSPSIADMPPTINDDYICWVCRNPHNVRKSQKYIYSNDFLTKGKLPSLSELNGTSEPAALSQNGNAVNSLMLSSLMDEVSKMQEILSGIKQKIRIVTTPGEHVLLNTWHESSDDKSSRLHPSAQKVKGKNGRKGRTSSADDDQEAYIRQCRENLLDHITELEGELDNRITLLTNFVSSIESGAQDEGEQIKGVENLQKGLTAVQKLLSYC